MSGALIASFALGGIAGGGSGGADATPDAIAFSNINGDIVAFGNSQTINGINTPISLQITWTGVTKGLLCSIAGGGNFAITNGQTVVLTNAQTLSFGVQCGAAGAATGTVTVTNLSDSSAVIATFNYDVTRSFI